MIPITPLQYDYIQYVLTIDGVEYAIPEPANWASAEKGFYRSVQYNGVIISVSDSVEFSGRTAIKLNEIYQRDGALANVILEERMTKEQGYSIQQQQAIDSGGLYAIDSLGGYGESYERESIAKEGNDYVPLFGGELDFSTATRTYDTFSCKINSDELTKKLQSRWRTEVSFENEEDLDGNTIPNHLNWTNVKMSDRGLVGENQLDIGTPYTTVGIYDSHEHPAILLTNKSDTFYSLNTVQAVGRETFGTLESLFYFNSMTQDLMVSLLITFDAYIDTLQPNESYLSVDLVLWNIIDDGTDITLTEESTLTLAESVYLSENKTVSYSNSLQIEVGEHQGLSLNFHYYIFPVGEHKIVIETANVNISANTEWGVTYAKALLPMESFGRIIELIGGRNFQSDFLTNSRLAMTNGFNIRNVPDKSDITYTFQKLFNSYDSVYPLGLEVCGKTIRIENREYFYQKFIAIDFGTNVTDVRFEHDSELGYSEVNLGFETSNFGSEGALDEFAVRSVWATPVNVYRKVLSMVSSIQASSNVIETLRRVQYSSTEDRTSERRGDSTLFFLDLKDDADELRRWEDDFDEIPENIDNPTKAYNLRISPMNRLRKLGAWVNHGFMKFTDKYLTFASSTGDTGMITQPKGEVAMAENDSVLIGDIAGARFVNEKCFIKVRPIDISTVLAETENGVSKVYGLFKFEYKEVGYQGYLISYKPELNEVELILEN